jgi:uncharacterized protein YciU (UPF0263 family)
MTDEEMAEEWRNSLNYEIDNDTFNNIVIPCIEFGYNKAKEEAKDIINELLMNGYNESTRDKALNFLYPDKEE